MHPIHPTLQREQPGDQPFLAKLYATTRQAELDAAGLLGPIRDIFVEHQFQAQTRSYAASFPSADRWLILSNSQPVGRLMVAATQAELRLVDIALLPSHQRQGIGTRLIQDLQGQAAKQGVPIRMHAVPDGPAEALYRRLGFRRIHGDALHVALEWTPPARPDPDPEPSPEPRPCSVGVSPPYPSAQDG